MEKKLAILGYHKIGAPPGDWYTWNYVPEKTFEDQMQYLKDNEWQVIDVHAFLNGISNIDLLPQKAALITFDDGYRSNLEVAVPILQSFSYPAVVFVPTSFIGGYNAFDADVFVEPKESICTWDELKQLEMNNVSVQSHGVTHRHFSQLSVEELVAEVAESKATLEKNLNNTVAVFSFPYGDSGFDQELTEGVLGEAGYKAAVLYGGSPVTVSSLWPFRLARVAIGPDTNFDAELTSTL